MLSKVKIKMEDQSSKRAEAERCLAIAEKLLVARDLTGARKFALQARMSDTRLDGVDQVIAASDVLSASVQKINHHMNWYAILQLNPNSKDLDREITSQYKKLSLLLNAEKSKSPVAKSAMKLIDDAWRVLSDRYKRGLYDKELEIVTKTGKKVGENINSKIRFWTTCPFCCYVYEYERKYERCNLRCQNCKRAFCAVEITTLPPIVPGLDAYYSSWVFFPIAFSDSNSNFKFDGILPSEENGKDMNFSTWNPFIPVYPLNKFQSSGRHDDSLTKTDTGFPYRCDLNQYVEAELEKSSEHQNTKEGSINLEMGFERRLRNQDGKDVLLPCSSSNHQGIEIDVNVPACEELDGLGTDAPPVSTKPQMRRKALATKRKKISEPITRSRNLGKGSGQRVETLTSNMETEGKTQPNDEIQGFSIGVHEEVLERPNNVAEGTMVGDGTQVPNKEKGASEEIWSVLRELDNENFKWEELGDWNP